MQQNFIMVNPWDPKNTDIKFLHNNMGDEFAKKDGVLRLTKKTFFNKKHPENHNIYAPTPNREDIKIYTGKAFKKPRPGVDPIKETINLMRHTFYTFTQQDPEEADFWADDGVDTCMKYHETFADDPSSHDAVLNLFHKNKDLIEKTHGIISNA
jgi:hypothetical protein